MEKQRIKSGTESFRRLLILALLSLFYSSLCAQGIITQAQAASLLIVPSENQMLYTKSDIKFEVLIPKTDASSIILQTSRTPADVTMRTMRKSQEYGENPGTRLELWYNFEKKGEYKIPSLNLLISGRHRTIAFESVKIVDNPESLLPRVVILFPDDQIFYSDEYTEENDKKGNVKAFLNWKAGQKIPFKVCLEHAVQLVAFNWEIPVDSIFTQTKTYDIVEIKYREKKYSDELIPVADFEWTSLTEGKKSFPKIRLTATGYKGVKSEIYIPEFFIDFTKAETENEEESDFSLFDSSFIPQESSGDNADLSEEADGKVTLSLQNREISLEDCKKLSQLRRKEREEIFSWRENIKNREEFESSLGITGSINEFYMGFFYFSVIVLIICGLLLAFFIRQKSVLPAFLLSPLMIFALVYFIFVFSQKNRIYGISKGCTIRSIPETSAKAESRIGEGNRVQITEEAGKWIYVQMGETGGWCFKDEVIFIN